MSRFFLADRGDARLRLDQAIVRRLSDVPRVSRTRVQRWIDQRLVLVNERPARRASSPIAVGDRITVTAPDALVQRAIPLPEKTTIDILYEDEHLLALNKPAGVVVHPSYKHASGTLLNAIMGHLHAVATRSDTAPRLIHRLDKLTSGVLLVSKTMAVHATLQRAMSSGGMRKEYLAVVHGRPRRGSGIVALALGADPHDRRRVVVREDGRASETRYEVMARGTAMSLLRCELVTGRMHQIRVHLAASGWPIVGDPVYGKPGDAFPRQALHAWRLGFVHPVSGVAMKIVAPLAPDMEALLDAQGLPGLKTRPTR